MIESCSCAESRASTRCGTMGKEPRDWTSEQFAGANEGLEVFQVFYFDEVHEMVNITNIHGQDRQN